MDYSFFIREPDKIVDLWGHKPVALSSYVRKKLSLYKKNDILYILDMLQCLVQYKISAEVVFFNDNGKELYMEFPELADNYIAIADDGQGDSWLMNLENGKIFFFDHGKLENPLTPLNIEFNSFLQLADLIAQWEFFLDTAPRDTSKQEIMLWSEMRKLDEKLPEMYPFRLQ